MTHRGPHGIISPISYLLTTDSDAAISNIGDSSNVASNSVSCDAKLIDMAESDVLNGENFNIY